MASDGVVINETQIITEHCVGYGTEYETCQRREFVYEEDYEQKLDPKSTHSAVTDDESATKMESGHADKAQEEVFGRNGIRKYGKKKSDTASVAEDSIETP